MTINQLAAESPVATATPRDVRGFWRVLLAVLAPLPMLAKGIYYIIVPVDGGADFATSVAGFTAHDGITRILPYLDMVFVAGLIPATIAVAWAARRTAPRLTTVGAAIALTGFFAGVSLLGGILTPSLMTARHALDTAAIGKLDDALNEEPIVLGAGLLFIIAVVFGLLLLGLALWRSRVAPAWMGFALAVGGFTHPFLPGHVAQGAGLFVAAVGFAGASVALLRMRNDEFDLPPRAAA
ncbi:hypothetical protein [Dactylosporangium sp. NPDC050588]|uniref:hypothetical protein n=1 Tax=Dactylosporangium sp. NPDC050588 TaxID=3157211 RepID=UPI0033CB3FEB